MEWTQDDTEHPLFQVHWESPSQSTHSAAWEPTIATHLPNIEREEEEKKRKKEEEEELIYTSSDTEPSEEQITEIQRRMLNGFVPHIEWQPSDEDEDDDITQMDEDVTQLSTLPHHLDTWKSLEDDEDDDDEHHREAVSWNQSMEAATQPLDLNSSSESMRVEESQFILLVPPKEKKNKEEKKKEEKGEGEDKKMDKVREELEDAETQISTPMEVQVNEVEEEEDEDEETRRRREAEEIETEKEEEETGEVKEEEEVEKEIKERREEDEVETEKEEEEEEEEEKVVETFKVEEETEEVRKVEKVQEDKYTRMDSLTEADQVFSGIGFSIEGAHSTTQADLKKLIREHGGIVMGAVSEKVNYLLGTEEGLKKCTTKVQRALHLNIPIVSENFLHECIKAGRILDSGMFQVMEKEVETENDSIGMKKKKKKRKRKKKKKKQSEESESIKTEESIESLTPRSVPIEKPEENHTLSTMKFEVETLIGESPPLSQSAIALIGSHRNWKEDVNSIQQFLQEDSKKKDHVKKKPKIYQYEMSQTNYLDSFEEE